MRRPDLVGYASAGGNSQMLRVSNESRATMIIIAVFVSIIAWEILKYLVRRLLAQDSVEE